MIKRLLIIISLLGFYIHDGFTTPVPVTEAFSLSAQKQDANYFKLIWKIKPQHYLYKNTILLHPLTSDIYKIGQFHMPSATLKLDKATNKQREVYTHFLELSIPILGQSAGEAILYIQYQGCAQSGYCYPQQTVAYIVQINPDLSIKQLIPTIDPTITPPPDLHGNMVHFFNDHTYWLLLLSFFGFGLLLTFTPCVLPLLPILSSIILSHSTNTSTRKAFLISLYYVLGLSVTYAGLGVVFALLGQNLQLFFQKPWMHAVLAILFIILSLSMFELFEIRPPAHWQAWLSQFSQRKRTSPYLSAFFIGLFSALVLSPCVTPPLVGAFAYIAQTGNIWLGGSALFCLGLGSGTPLLLITTSAAHYLPKAGHWMYGVKACIGLILLGLAVYYLSLLLPPILTMALWGCLLLTTGIFIGALTPAYSTLEKAKQSVGIICFVSGLLIFVGASMGNTSPLQPLHIKQASFAMTVPTTTINNLPSLQHLLKQYAHEPIILDFYADWCSECYYIQKHVIEHPTLMPLLHQVQLITVDVTANQQAARDLLNIYHVVAPPTFIFINRQGEEVETLRITGTTDVQTFSKHIHMLLRQ